MRLIDADILKTRDILDKLREAEFDDEIEAVIDSVPTAYDIEAKMTELEKLKADALEEYERTCCTGGYEHDYADGASDAYDKSIEIVQESPVRLVASEVEQEEDEKTKRICSIEAALNNELYDTPAQKLAYEAELQFLEGNTNGYDEPTAWIDVENGETLEVSLESADGTLVMTIYDKEGNPTLPHYRGDTLDELFEGYFDDKEEERE